MLIEDDCVEIPGSVGDKGAVKERNNELSLEDKGEKADSNQLGDTLDDISIDDNIAEHEKVEKFLQESISE